MKLNNFNQFKRSKEGWDCLPAKVGQAANARKGLLIGSFIIGFFLLNHSEVRGTTWVVNAFNFSFAPMNITVTVGDSVKWQWLNGNHTTTSLTIPSGAAPWDSPLNASNQTFIYRITVSGTYNYKCTPHFPGMEGNIMANPIGIIKQEGEVPDKFKLHQNYPNPFNPVTKIRFDIPSTANVKLLIYDILGSEAAVLVNEELEAGTYEADWNAVGFPSGVYFYRIVTADYTETRKMDLIK